MYRYIVLLSACVSAHAIVNMPCKPHPTPEYRDKAMQCSGMKVRKVPTLLRNSLQKLLLTGTDISSLGSDSFHGRNLPELTTLYVTEGKLGSVGAHAFCPLTALTVLHLDRNQLNTLDELSFSCNKVLRTVSLVGNRSLRQLPRLVSSSVENLYLDGCNLASIDVATVEGLTALKVLSVTGNPRLDCPSVEEQFKKARPDLLVVCRDPAADLPSSTFPSDEERQSEQSLSESDSAIKITESDTTGEEDRDSVKSQNESDSATRNKKKDSIANAASCMPSSTTTIAAICIVVIISIL